MNEVRLTSTGSTAPIAPTTGVVPAAPVQLPPAVAPPPPHDAPAVSLGGTLATLDDGDRLEGVVIGEDASGLPILRTANGSYLLTSAQPIAQNTYLVLQIIGSGDTIQALILTENGVAQQPPPEVQLALLGPDARSLLETAALTDVAAALPERGSERRLVGTVLPDSLAGRPGHARPLPAGSTLVLQVTDAPEGAAKSSQASAEQPANTKAGSTDGAAPTRNVNSDSLSTLGEALPAEAARTAIGPPTQPFPPTQPITTIAGAALAGSRISGLVIAAPTAGQALIRTPLGLLSVESRTPLAAGASLTLEVVSVKLPTKERVLGSDAFGNPLSRLSHEWPALREALLALQAADEAGAQLIVEAAVPALSDKLTSGLLFFFSALRGGSVAGWLGKSALDQLDRAGRRDLLHRLTDDFADLSHLGRQNGPGEWRAVPLPLYDGHRIIQIMLYARNHHRQDEAGESKDLGTRFILDIELTVTGPIQLDGLMQQKQFDLIVRSHTALPSDIRQGMSDIFNDCLATARRRGMLAFQVSQRFPPMPMQELRVGRSPTAIVV